jgi:hypothetical protein
LDIRSVLFSRTCLLRPRCPRSVLTGKVEGEEEISNEIGQRIRRDQVGRIMMVTAERVEPAAVLRGTLDPLMAFGNCRAHFKEKSQLSVRKLLYGRRGPMSCPCS